MAIQKTTTQNGVRTFHTAGKYCDQDIEVTTAVPATVPVTETRTVSLDMASGDQVVSKSANVDGMTQVTIEKPATFLPENIKKDIVIGGVTGTFEGSGGGAEKYLVQVFDYDGTLLKSEELTAGSTFTLPSVPVNSRLVFQEWSCPVEIVNGAITVPEGDVNIGAVYTTASGMSEFDIELTPATSLTVAPHLCCASGEESLYQIDWGDGTITNPLPSSSPSHQYATYGRYTIKSNAPYIYNNFASASASSPNFYYKRIFMVTQTSGIAPYTGSTGLTGDFGYFEGLEVLCIAKDEHPRALTRTAVLNYCHSLKHISIPSNFISFVINDLYSLESVSIPLTENKLNGSWLGNGFRKSKSIYLPPSLSLSGGVINGAFGLEKLNLHYVNADDDTSTSSITFQNGLYSSASDRSGAFRQGTTTAGNQGQIPVGLRKVTVKGGKIIDNAFMYCRSIEEVELPAGITSIGASAFAYSGIKSIEIPETVTTIGNTCFRGCRFLREIELPSGVTVLPSGVFQNCDFETFEIPNTIDTLSDYVFSQCFYLKNIVIPNTVTSIGNYAFYTCYSLKEITIPNTVASLGSSVFSNCYTLKKCDFSTFTSIPTLGTSAFNKVNTSLKIVVPDNLYSQWITETNWVTYANYIYKASEVQ